MCTYTLCVFVFVMFMCMCVCVLEASSRPSCPPSLLQISPGQQDGCVCLKSKPSLSLILHRGQCQHRGKNMETNALLRGNVKGGLRNVAFEENTDKAIVNIFAQKHTE